MKKASEQDLSPFIPKPRPLLIILSGPSGVGKDAVLSGLKTSDSHLHFVITTTTRQQRPKERDGFDYHFVSVEKFEQMLRNKELLESANVYGNWYGVPKADVIDAFKQGQDVIVKVDVQGAANIKKIVPQAIFIFLAPPSLTDLQFRLNQRHTESPADLDLRLQTADREMKQLPLFDYVVVNLWEKLDLAVADIKAIIRAEKCRVKPREINL